MTPIYNAICQHARQTPKQVAIQTRANHNTTSLTYEQLQRTLSALHETLGTWQGKRVALYAHNDIDWVILDLALSTVGAVVFRTLCKVCVLSIDKDISCLQMVKGS